MPEIARVRYTHDAVIDEILVNPSISQNELAKIFGFSAGWMSIVINSDSFQERLAERKAMLTDPKIIASINERLDAIAAIVWERIATDLHPARLDRIADKLVTFDELPAQFDDYIKGRVTGRTVVRISR